MAVRLSEEIVRRLTVGVDTSYIEQPNTDYDLYVVDKASADTITIRNETAAKHLQFSRSGSWNYITVPAANGSILAVGWDAQGDSSILVVEHNSTNSVRPGVNNSTTLGTSARAWSQAYVNGIHTNVANKNDAGGISLYGTTITTYGIAMRAGAAHGWIMAKQTNANVARALSITTSEANGTDWNVNFYNSGSLLRGWKFMFGTTTVASINGHGFMQVNRLSLNCSSSNISKGYGRLYWGDATRYDWVDYVSNSTAGYAPTGGQPPTLGGVTSWARRFAFENQNNYGWLWEAASSSVSTTNTDLSIPRMALSSYTGRLYTAAIAATDSLNQSNLTLSSVENGSSGTIGLEFYRGTNISWQIAVDSDILYIRNNRSRGVSANTTAYSSDCISVNSDGDSYFPGNMTIGYLGQQYFKLYPITRGTTSAGGDACVEIGNSLASNLAENARGRVRLYHTDANYADVQSNGWISNGSIEAFTFLGATSKTANTAAYTTIIIGNNANVTTTTAHSQGRIRLYAKNTNYTQIYSQGNGDRDFFLPNYAGSMYAIHAGDNNAVGTEYIPIYAAANGRATRVTDNSVITNLASTSGVTIWAASPRPGVTGTLPSGNGGTGSTSYTAWGIIYANNDSPKKLVSTAAGTQDYILKANTSAAPTWTSAYVTSEVVQYTSSTTDTYYYITTDIECTAERWVYGIIYGARGNATGSFDSTFHIHVSSAGDISRVWFNDPTLAITNFRAHKRSTDNILFISFTVGNRYGRARVRVNLGNDGSFINHCKSISTTAPGDINTVIGYREQNFYHPANEIYWGGLWKSIGLSNGSYTAFETTNNEYGLPGFKYTSQHFGNHTFGITEPAITIETTTNGSTWTTGTSAWYTPARKQNLFNFNETQIPVGNLEAFDYYDNSNGVPLSDGATHYAAPVAAGMGVRVTVDFTVNTRRFYMNAIETYWRAYIHVCTCTIEGYCANTNTWTTIFTGDYNNTDTRRYYHFGFNKYISNQSNANYFNKLRWTMVIKTFNTSTNANRRYAPSIAAINVYGLYAPGTFGNNEYRIAYSMSRYNSPIYLSSYTNAGEARIPTSVVYIGDDMKNTVANTEKWSTLVIGNGSNVNAENVHSQGQIQIYSAATKMHCIRGTSTTTDYYHYFPNSTGWIVTGGNGTSTGIGDTTHPVYLETTGLIKQCSATIANNISGIAEKATRLANQGRKTDANYAHATDGGMQLLLATSSMTSNKPSADGFILHFHWDTTSAWDSQLYISDSGSAMQYRGSSSAGTWIAWKTLLDSSNYSTYAMKRDGDSVSGAYTFSGTLTLTKTTDASGTADNKPALIVGGASTAQHIEIDGNEILSKSNGTTPGTLYLQDSTGIVSVSGSGGLAVTATTACTSTTTGAVRIGGGVGIGGAVYTGASINATAGDINALAGSIWAGTAGSTSAERDIGAQAGAGKIYLYAAKTTTGNVGIYHYNAAGTGTAVMTINQTNRITAHAAFASGTINVKAAGSFVKGTQQTSSRGASINFTDNVNENNGDAVDRIGLIYSYIPANGLNSRFQMYAYKVAASSDTDNTYFAVAYLSDGTKRTYTDAKVYSAVWNDYAEFRCSVESEPGRVLIEDYDGQMKIANARLLPACRVYSDTFGMAIGETEKDRTPIAVSGRVLVYPYKDRSEYRLGDAVCSAPNGTVDIMTREEIMMYPERIIGTVSEIPQYEQWECGYAYDPDEELSKHEKHYIPVNGRIWIYVR